MNKELKNLYIEKLNRSGQGVGTLDGITYKVWNALPGEVVDVLLPRKRKKAGVALNIVEESPSRTDPLEDHFLSCSPLQVLEWSQENNYKLNVFREYIKDLDIGYDLEDITIVSDADAQRGYRNKMEFGFTFDEEDKVSLSFFQRGGRFKRIPIQSCVLADSKINDFASRVIDKLNENLVRANSLKSLIVRCVPKGGVIGGLFVKREDCIPLLDNVRSIDGLEIFFSNSNSPASIVSSVIKSEAAERKYLEYHVNGVRFRFSLFSFFQVNLGVFEEALKDISTFVGRDDSLIDFYSGVGSIGLSLSSKCKEVLLVDSSAESIRDAEYNIENNKIKNAKAFCCPSEKMLDIINEDKVLILDPPRVGLHKDVTQKILEERPKKIIYLSCNSETQHRDLLEFREFYSIKFARAYNFFPKTPHYESLVVLNIQ